VTEWDAGGKGVEWDGVGRGSVDGNVCGVCACVMGGGGAATTEKQQTPCFYRPKQAYVCSCSDEIVGKCHRGYPTTPAVNTRQHDRRMTADVLVKSVGSHGMPRCRVVPPRSTWRSRPSTLPSSPRSRTPLGPMPAKLPWHFCICVTQPSY